MSTAVSAGPRVLHAIPGRFRAHLPGGSPWPHRHMERRLRQVPGVRKAEANPLTRNVLVHFDPRVTDHAAVLAALSETGLPFNGRSHLEGEPPPAASEGETASPPLPPVLVE